MKGSWTPNFIPTRVAIFGCGGTGSRVVPLIAQFLKSCPWVPDPKMYLFDFDTVETKNLARQNFIAADVGKYKSSVLANRYSKAFGLEIIPYTTKLTTASRTNNEADTWNHFYDEIKKCPNRDNTIYILCVDTPSARRDILDTLLDICRYSHNNLIIDAGNENDFGQVTVSSLAGEIVPTAESMIGDKLLKLTDSVPLTCKLPFIPINKGYFDTMVSNSAPSCAELDQTMAINTLMAVNIFGIVQNVYYVKPIDFHRLNISLKSGCTPELIDQRYLINVRPKNGEDIRKGAYFQEAYDDTWMKWQEFLGVNPAKTEVQPEESIEDEDEDEDGVEEIVF